jgi:hypothetical protein
MRIILLYLFIIIAVLGLGFWLYQASKPKSPDKLPGQAFDIVSRNHIPEGEHPKIPYNSNPPTSGDHWPQPAACGHYDQTQPDERLVHNLEHGGIWISYKPTVDDKTKSELKDYANRFANLIVEPREGDDSNIALAAWGHLLKLDAYDEGRILEFINAFIDKGPGQVPCARM